MTQPNPPPLVAEDLLATVERPPAPWWALNGHVLLVALLAVFIVGLNGITDGPASPIDWFYRVGSIAAGIGLIYGLFAANTRAESWAGGMLVVVNLADALNEVLTTVPPSITWRTVEIQIIIVVGVSARIFALWRGGASIIPPWRR